MPLLQEILSPWKTVIKSLGPIPPFPPGTQTPIFKTKLKQSSMFSPLSSLVPQVLLKFYLPLPDSRFFQFSNNITPGSNFAATLFVEE